MEINFSSCFILSRAKTNPGKDIEVKTVKKTGDAAAPKKVYKWELKTETKTATKPAPVIKDGGGLPHLP